MSINIGNTERESWWATNNTNETILIGDISNLPSIYARKRIDLLAHATKKEISKSSNLPNLMKTGKISLNKKKNYTNLGVDDDITPAFAERSIMSAEENEIGAIIFQVTELNRLIKTRAGINALIETGISVDNDDHIHNVGAISFQLDHAPAPHETGHIHWNEEDGTLEIDLAGDEVVLQIGQENVIYIRNLSGALLPNGKVVYLDGSQGNSNRPSVSLADNTDPDTIHIAGMTTEEIAVNGLGYITTQGKVRGVNTSLWTSGDKLYLSTEGNLTNEHPSSSTEAVIVVGRSVDSKIDGTIEVIFPQAFSVGATFNGTLRQSVLNKSDGTLAASGFTAVNDLNHFTTMGIAGSNNAGFKDAQGDPVSVYYAPGYGDHWQAVDGAKDFVWFIDPLDRHVNGALEYERMRLTSAGDLYIKDGDVHIQDTAERDDPSASGGNLHVANNVFLSNLPTSDPGVVGAVYNDLGTLKISL
jgi:hypothetical protein